MQNYLHPERVQVSNSQQATSKVPAPFQGAHTCREASVGDARKAPRHTMAINLGTFGAITVPRHTMAINLGTFGAITVPRHTMAINLGTFGAITVPRHAMAINLGTFGAITVPRHTTAITLAQSIGDGSNLIVRNKRALEEKV